MKVNHFIQKHNIPGKAIEVLFVPYQDIHPYFQMADFALNPVKPVPSKRYCTSIKDGEYWAAGLPVVITKNISDDSEIIQNNSVGYVLNSLENTEYVNACFTIDELLKHSKSELTNKIIALAKKHRGYHIAEEVYKNIYL